MAETVFRGPGVVLGALMDGRNEAFDGPSIGYQGDIIADPRFAPAAKDGLAPGRIAGFYNAWFTVTADGVPQTTSSTIVAAAQAPSSTAGVGLNLTTAVIGASGAAAWAPGIPILPVGTSNVVTVSAIDFGFTQGTTAANSSTVVVADNTQFYLGQWIVIAGGNSSNVACITQVTSIATANYTGITVSPAPATAISNAPIGQGNLYTPFLPGATQFGPAAASASYAEPYRLAGLAKAFDPAQALTRNITISAATVTNGTSKFLVTGYDVYGNLMTELISCTAGIGGQGKKAFKYISSVVQSVPATTGANANASVGLGNLIGMNLRSDKWEYLDLFWNGGFATNSAGWTAAQTTAPATSTTGDVRGTQNVSTILAGGPNGTSVPGAGFNGTSRVTVFQQVPMVNAFASNPSTSILLFGVAQSTATS